MASGARVVRIFVGGPDDTRSERQMVVDVLVNHLQKELGERFSLKPFTYDDRFLPVMMEAADPQASINEVCAVGEADLVIMLFKGSLGASRPPAGSTAPSASTWELEEAVRGGKALGVLVAQLASHNPQPVQSGSTVPEVQTAYLTMYEHWLRQEKLQADLQHYMLSHRDEFGRRCPSLRTVRMDANIADVIHRFVTEALAVPAADPAPEDTPGYFEGFPYCGLIEFTYDHRMAYFGRTEEVAEIVQRCSGPDPVPLLLVHGSSGVGKSSLLQAGVLREIERGGDPVQHLVFEPAGDTGRPFRQFATAFKNLVQARVRATDAELGERFQALFTSAGGGDEDGALQAAAQAFEAQVVQAVLGAGQKQSFVPVIVNQMEQLFALADGERESFLRFIASARYFRRIRLLCSIREEYMSPLTRHQHVNAALDARGRSDYYLKPPLRRQMAEMILAPWASVGVQIGDEFRYFAEEILDDAVAAGDAALPLLSQALFVLHNTCGRAITRAAYERLGRLKGAVSQVAEAATRNIAPPELNALFRCLTSMHGGRWMRETTKKGDLLRAGVGDALVEELAGRTVRLLHIGKGAGGEAVVQLAHDVLFEAWDALQRYTVNARSNESERAEVVEDARRWAADGQRERHLKLRGEPYHRIAARLRDDPALFGGPDRELVEQYIERARGLELRGNLIAAINAGWLGEAADILKQGGRLRLEDRGNGPASLREAIWAAVTGNDRENPDPRNWDKQPSPAPEAESLFVKEPKLAVSTVTRGWTIGHLAALCGRLPLLRRLIELRPDLASRRSEGGSNLVGAATVGGDLETVRYLVEELGLPFDETDEDGSRPIIWAVQKKHSAVQAYLKQRGANPQVTTHSGFGTLSEAARSGDVEEVRQALESGFDIDARTLDGQSALMISVQAGHAEVVRFLLARRADPQLRTQHGATALHCAAWQTGEQSDVVDLLVAAGAERDAVDNDDDTPLHLAASQGKVQLVKRLIAAGARRDPVNSSGYTPLLAATARGYATVVRELLLAGADISVAEASGWTSLHFAAEDGDQTTMHELLLHPAASAILEQRTRDAWTPLMLAARRGHPEVARKLVDSGADRRAANASGLDVLALAIKSLSAATVRAILAYRSDAPAVPAALDDEPGGSDTAVSPAKESRAEPSCDFLTQDHISLAASTGSLEIIEAVLAAGGEVSAPDSLGETALHHAARLGLVEVVEFLASEGARLDEPGDIGRSPLEIADEFDQQMVVAALRRLGATVPVSWERRRLTESIRFLRFEPPAAELEARLRQKFTGLAQLNVPLDRAVLRVADLPFYENGLLVAVEDPARHGLRERFVLVHDAADRTICSVLRWRNAEIYDWNDRFGIGLADDAAVIAYMQFFFCFVRGEQGRFQVVERVDDLDWLAEATDADRARVARHLQPIRVIERTADFVRLSGVVCFNTALFRTDAIFAFHACKILVPGADGAKPGLESFTIGQAKPMNEQLLEVDLPVRVPGPPGPFG